MNKIIIISGTTASGKSNAALQIAQKLNGEIINADSMQIYQEIPILSAQPSQAEQKTIPHHLYSILNGNEKFSVADWLDLAQEKIEYCFANRKTPILVGGTGMYIKSLRNGISSVPYIPDITRASSTKLLDKIGHNAFHAKLMDLDKKTASKLSPNDTNRILRAYNVITETGIGLAQWQEKDSPPPYPAENFIHFIITPEREALYKKCEERFLTMIKMGAIDEVKSLLNKNYPPETQISKAIGIKELSKHITGEISLEEAITLGQTATRQYAKRQVTWFKNQNPENSFIFTEINIAKILEIIEDIKKSL
jgi:tRNA dimethylallyltransferase